MKKRNLTHLTATFIGILILLFFFPLQAKAKNFFTRPIEFVCHGGAGGGSDIFARLVQSIIEKEKITSHPIAVVNRPGGAGSTAFAYVAAKKGDPHYWLTSTTSFIVTPLQRKTKTSYKDFTGLTNLCYDDFFVVVRADSPYKSMGELIKAAKKNPDEIKVGGAYAPGTDAVVAHLIQKETGTKFNYIPFKSGSEYMIALLGGHVDVAIPNPCEALAHMEAGKIRALCVTSEKRMEAFPDLPTLKEQGYNVVYQQFRSIAAPKDLPKEAVAFYDDLFKRLANSKRWKENYVEKNIMTWDCKTSAETYALWERENERYVRVLQEMGFIK